ncbi:alpha/beta hydrolase [Faecalibacter rhinopitheci]|uniref:Alpha/beta hydrolase n=1 Tax=Faecalibacter rhinopitheci TaxID=2779678 RepID=A0A8J7FNJ5_9FLAO|nr:alpha/beta hydrolase-fold protein [Faecalibacter rhinopitheci]MBF0597075.1 alpha/beta hydrolase [Faecalibacter rhinopitheci]
MKKLLYLFIIFFSANLFAQEKVAIGEIQKIQSNVLGTEREIWINLPVSYRNSKLDPAKYPVIYVLDAEDNFTFLTGIVNKFQKGHYQEMPESIIVGITNKNGDRTKDFTHVNDAKFLQFIQTELFPFMEKNYRVENYRLLLGHSLGGYFALKTLYNQPEMFNGYVAHDPSIWFNDFELKKLYQNVKLNDFKNRLLMITQVGERQNFGHLQDHYGGIKAVHSLINEAKNQSLNYTYRQYADEEHGSVPMIGNIDFMRWMFDGYRINIKDVPNQPNLIEGSFKAFSSKRNFTFQPQETYIHLVATYLVKQKKFDLAKKYFEYNVNHFPQSEQAKEALKNFKVE